ncbi:hypothetical protein BCF44_121211 [Kutzneria buriramensis]|uniref:Uncharacterized protein n=2 Tax=Kutzneria buriramensis TaxID=1045776 RepID=A0A3E0GXT3_9PSEU|nr:hypothetical protein BCF44_121211 [Kutzneria buriramensis]
MSAHTAGMATLSWSLPVLIWCLALATDLWVYVDAKARADQGDPVVVTIGAWRIDNPVTWFLCCLVLWILFLPLYLRSRQDKAPL